MRLVFFLEESSMEVFLEEFLSRNFPQLEFLFVVFDGAKDLELSFHRKLRHWRIPGDRFVVVRDNDGGDCYSRKKKLSDLCSEAGREDVLVRIVCQELEAWYLGDLDALADAYDDPSVLKYKEKAKFRNPDSISRPADQVGKFVERLSKRDAARRLGRVIDVESNRSNSLRVFVEGVRRLIAESE